jgi:cell division protein FtsW (lipid II flippase)
MQMNLSGIPLYINGYQYAGEIAVIVIFFIFATVLWAMKDSLTAKQYGTTLAAASVVLSMLLWLITKNFGTFIFWLVTMVAASYAAAFGKSRHDSR